MLKKEMGKQQVMRKVLKWFRDGGNLPRFERL